MPCKNIIVTEEMILDGLKALPPFDTGYYGSSREIVIELFSIALRAACKNCLDCGSPDGINSSL